MIEKYINAHNPILPLKYHIPDAEAHCMSDGKLYIYGSYDKESGVFCSREYLTVSTPDMKEWTIHETAFASGQVKWTYDENAPKYQGLDWSKPTPFLLEMMKRDAEKGVEIDFSTFPKDMLFAPDAIEKDGKYYLYFCMSDDSEGVAVSDKPEGPFINPKQLACGGIDPSVFIDDDGQAYFYWGQLFGHGAKLKEDMMTLDENSIVYNLVTEEKHFFHEGSSVRKRGDIYYYVFADMERGKPSSLGYAISKSPLGPFEYKGIIIDNDGSDPNVWNNHGSIEEFNGQWYVFYHRSSRNEQAFRRLCIEPITFNEDGTINEVKMTSQGIGDPFALGEKIMAYHACQLSGTAYLTPYGEKSEVLTSISSGDTATFRYVKSKEDYKNIEIKANGSGMIKIFMNDVEAGYIKISNGEVSNKKFSMNSGEYELGLKFEESEGLELIELILY